MAGIGFELRRLLRGDSFAGLLRGYGYAGLISSGSWVLSILGVMLIGLLAAPAFQDPSLVTQFQVAITYLMATSLISTGPLQLSFSRFVADRIYERREERIIPNLVGVLVLTTAAAALLGALALATLFPAERLSYRLLLLSTFIVLCDLWVLVVMLSGLKEYKAVLKVFLVGYVLSVGLAVALRGFGETGLLAGFFAGQAFMLVGFLTLVLSRYPAPELCSFEFLHRNETARGLALTGLVYNLAIWSDKLLFWFNPSTSYPVAGPLRASILYDMPMFLAYLSIVPGMAVYLVRIETDFAEQHQAFYAAVRSGEPLGELERLRVGMTDAVRQGLYEIFKVQGLTVIFLVLAGPALLRLLGLSPAHLPLYTLDLVAVGMQVVLLAVLNVLYYFDQRRVALWLSAGLLVTNTAFTLLSQLAGPLFYGLGFASAVTLTAVVGLGWLSRKMRQSRVRDLHAPAIALRQGWGFPIPRQALG